MFGRSLKQQPIRAGDLGLDDDAWSLYEGGTREEPVSIRRNHGLAHMAGEEGYEQLIYVSVPFSDPDERGLPAPEDFPRLNAFEDGLVETVGAGRETVLAAVVTRAGARNFLLYTRDEPAAREKVRAVAEQAGIPDVGYGGAADPTWDAYRKFMALR